MFCCSPPALQGAMAMGGAVFLLSQRLILSPYILRGPPCIAGCSIPHVIHVVNQEPSRDVHTGLAAIWGPAWLTSLGMTVFK